MKQNSNVIGLNQQPDRSMIITPEQLQSAVGKSKVTNRVSTL
jgi:hypothetical protein